MRVVKTEQNYLVEAARRGDTQALRTITDVEDIARPGDMQALRARGRAITDEFLASVADASRRNIAHAPPRRLPAPSASNHVWRRTMSIRPAAQDCYRPQSRDERKRNQDD